MINPLALNSGKNCLKQEGFFTCQLPKVSSVVPIEIVNVGLKMLETENGWCSVSRCILVSSNVTLEVS